MQKSSYYRYYVLGMLTLVSTINIADRLVVSILLEDIKAEFVLSDAQVGILAGLAFSLFYAFMGIPIARLADKTNRKNIISAALVIWSTMMALCGAAVGFVTFFLARVGVGIGEAGGSPPSFSIIGDYFKPHEMTRAMSIFITGGVFGTAGGLMLGGLLADAIGWRLTFVAMGLPGILVGIFFYFTVKEPVRGRNETEDETGGISAGILETLKSLLQNKVYVRAVIAFSLLTSIGFAIAIWLAPIMIRNYDVSLTKVGLYLGSGFLFAGIPGPIIGGLIVDRLVKKNQNWYIWFVVIAIILCLTLYYFSLTAYAFLAFISLFVIGYFCFMLPQGAALAIIQNSVSSGERALAFGFVLLFTNIVGMAIGPFVIGLISDNLASEYGARSMNYAVASFCIFAGFAACIFYFLTAVAMKKSGDLKDLSEV